MIMKSMRWAGVVLILIVGLIHAVETPEYLEESTVVGVLFILNVVGALLAAVGIYRQQRSWGWGLGAVVAGGAFVAYVLSRTVGLFGFYDGEWAEPLGLASLLFEAVFVVLAVRVFSARPQRVL